MSITKQLLTITTAFLCVGIASQTARGSITILPSTKVDIFAVDSSITGVPVGDTFASPPLSIGDSATKVATAGGSFSDNTLDWSINGFGQTVLSFVMNEHKRNGAAAVSHVSSAGIFENVANGIFFTLDVATPYELSGEYSVRGVEENRGFSLFRAFLGQTTVGGTSYFSTNQSATQDHEVDYSFSSLSGTSGVLDPGDYQWFFAARIDASGGSGPDQGATASGHFTLILGAPTDTGAVPEATSVLIWGLLGLTFAAGSWKRRER